MPQTVTIKTQTRRPLQKIPARPTRHKRGGTAWRVLFWGCVLILLGIWLYAVVEERHWQMQDQLMERDSAIHAANQSKLWFAIARLPELRDDPREAFRVGSDVLKFTEEKKLPSQTVTRFQKSLPSPKQLPRETSITDLRLHRFAPATIIELSVKDARGDFLSGLSRVDFEVFQGEHRLRRVAVATASRQGADQSVVLLFDCSTSMQGPPMQSAKEVGRDFVTVTANSARMQIWKFSDRASVLTPWTSESEVLAQAIADLTAQGATALYAGMHESILSLSQRNGHRSLVVLTDGEDSTKTIAPESLIKLSNQHKVELHVIGLLSGKIDDAVLRSFAKETHGSFHTAADGKGLLTAFQSITEKLKEPVYRLVILDRLTPGEPLTIRLDGVPEVSLPY